MESENCVWRESLSCSDVRATQDASKEKSNFSCRSNFQVSYTRRDNSPGNLHNEMARSYRASRVVNFGQDAPMLDKQKTGQKPEYKFAHCQAGGPSYLVLPIILNVGLFRSILIAVAWEIFSIVLAGLAPIKRAQSTIMSAIIVNCIVPNSALQVYVHFTRVQSHERSHRVS